MYNQSEVNSEDQHIWRNERQQVYNRLKNIARNLSCSYVDFRDSYDYRISIQDAHSDHVISSLLFDHIPTAEFWKNLDLICHDRGKKIWLVTDNLLDQEKFIFDNVKILSCPELLGITARNDIIDDPTPTPSRLYNCFMQRCESVRQSWFYFLWLEKLLDRGYVSYVLYQLEDYSKLVGVDLFDFIHYNKGLDQLEKFNEAHRSLRSQVPFRNFPENFDLITYVNDSKYSVILETYAIQDDFYQWCLTEKTLRSLQSNTINLLFAQKHSVKKLQELGLEIDEINQQWDHDDWIVRQSKILDTLKNDAVHFDVQKQKDRCRHNRALLQSWKLDYQRSDFFDSLVEDIKTA
jgi:hypothetical protein